MQGLVVAALLAVLPSPNPHLAVTVVQAPQARLFLETAVTTAQQERGLMSRTKLAPHTGMIFVFNDDSQRSFWMKDTLISLDMIFVASDGTVRAIFTSVPLVPRGMPDDKIPVETAKARYVIELAAGEAARDGIVPGVHLAIARAP
jgi:uncharacterized membrane protein (UPF0127 family)